LQRFAVNGYGGFRANDGTDAAAGAAGILQFCRVVAFAIQAVSQFNDFLRAGTHTELAALAQQFVNLDCSPDGHLFPPFKTDIVTYLYLI
jgi:hypothetical protein